MTSSVMTSPVKGATSFAPSAVTNHQSSNQTQNTCYSCVDDYQIPPCTGFSKDYSCLPSSGSNHQN
jgi:hypothetical protein